MLLVQETGPVRASRGGRPRDPSRDGVIRAAILRLLAEVGYGALTMDAVAAEAGVGKATIYRRWRTKHDLVVDTISDMSRAIAVPPETGSVEGDVRALMDVVVTTRSMRARASPSTEPVSGGTAIARLMSEIVSTTRSCFVRQRR